MANTSPPRQVQILIGNDNQDWSATFLEFTIGDPERGTDGLLQQRGKLVLTQTLGAPESMNPRSASGRLRFRRGQRVIIDVQDTSGAWRRHPRGWAYIAKTPLPPYPPDNILEIDLVCGIELQRFPQTGGLVAQPQIVFGPTPASPVQVFNLSRNDIINRCFQLAGTPAQVGVSVGRYPYNELIFSDPGQGGYADLAGKVAYGGIEALYQDNQGVIRSVNLALQRDTPIAVITIGRDEVGSYSPTEGGETPVEKITYEGTATRIKGSNQGQDDVPNPPQDSYLTSIEYGPASAVADDIGNGQIIIRRTQRIDGKTTNGKFTLTEVYEPLGIISALAYPKNAGLGLSSRIRTDHTYDSDGKLIRVDTAESQIFAKACATYYSNLTPTQRIGFANTYVDIISAEIHEYDGRDREIRITTTEQRSLAALITDERLDNPQFPFNPLDMKVSKIEVQEWREVRRDEWEKTTILRQPTVISRPDAVYNSTNINDRIAAKLALYTSKYDIESSTVGQATPNATEVRPIVIETEPYTISGSANFDVTNLGFSERERIYKLETGCTGVDQLQELAQIQGAVLIGRSVGARIQLPFLDAFLNNPRPLQTIAVIETEQLGSGWRQNLIFYQLDAMEYSINSEEAIVTANLIWLGTNEGAFVSYQQIPVTPVFEPEAIVPPYQSVSLDYTVQAPPADPGSTPDPIVVAQAPISIIPPAILETVAELGIGVGMDADDIPYSLTLSWDAELGIGIGLTTDFSIPIDAELGIGIGLESTFATGALVAEMGVGVGLEGLINVPIFADLGLGFGLETRAIYSDLVQLGVGIGAESLAIGRAIAEVGAGVGLETRSSNVEIVQLGIGVGLQGIIGVADLIYTATQSSTYQNNSNLTPSFTKLTDTIGTTGSATDASALQWIKANFGEPVTVSAVTVGGGTLSGWGGVASYLNNRVIQWSTDDSTWTTIATITSVSDTGINQFRTFSFTAQTAQYWRIAWIGGANSYVATTEFRFA